MKTCRRCGRTRPESEFYTHSKTTGRLRSTCKECDKGRAREKYEANPRYYVEKAKSWQEAHPERAKVLRRRVRRKADLKASWSMTPEEYFGRICDQDGRCAICRVAFPEFDDWGNTVDGTRAPHVDHCHKTGAVRGILCHGCNTGIGSLKDDPDLLRAAIDYLTGSMTSANERV